MASCLSESESWSVYEWLMTNAFLTKIDDNGGLRNPMERKAVSQPLSRPLSVPLSSIYPVNSLCQFSVNVSPALRGMTIQGPVPPLILVRKPNEPAEERSNHWRRISRLPSCQLRKRSASSDGVDVVSNERSTSRNAGHDTLGLLCGILLALLLPASDHENDA